jgi:hypothetical protein
VVIPTVSGMILKPSCGLLVIVSSTLYAVVKNGGYLESGLSQASAPDISSFPVTACPYKILLLVPLKNSLKGPLLIFWILIDITTKTKKRVQNLPP